MSVNRSWKPRMLATTLAVATILTLLAFYHKKDVIYKNVADDGPIDVNAGINKYSLDPQENSHPSWRAALPWNIDPKKYLPNYFTYYSMMNDTDRQRYRKSNFVYVHVPKSGGSTIADCFKSVYKKMNRFKVFKPFIGEHDHETFIDQNIKGRTQLGIYTGEFAFRLCDYKDGQPCGYFLLLRDPYERIISGYMYCKYYADYTPPRCALKPSNMTVVEWALIQRSFVFRQLIMNYSVCNSEYDREFDFENLIKAPKGIFTRGHTPCWIKLQAIIDEKLTANMQNELLQYLSHHIEHWFAVVGVLDNLMDAYQSLSSSFDLQVIPTCIDIHSNKGKNNKEDEIKLKNDYRQQLQNDPRVAEALHADIVLYERVKEISESQSKIRRLISN